VLAAGGIALAAGGTALVAGGTALAAGGTALAAGGTALAADRIGAAPAGNGVLCRRTPGFIGRLDVVSVKLGSAVAVG
jgi:hypothetical protein